MGVLRFDDASVRVNSVDLSDHVRSVTITHTAAMLDRTAMGDSSRRRFPGLKDWSVSVEFNQDFAAAKVDDTLNGLIGSTSFTIGILPTSTGVSATNPIFTGKCLLESYPPMGNAVGEFATVTATFQGDGNLTRGTTST